MDSAVLRARVCNLHSTTKEIRPLEDSLVSECPSGNTQPLDIEGGVRCDRQVGVELNWRNGHEHVQELVVFLLETFNEL